MSEEASKLAEKLLSEGERALAFFRALPEDAWARTLYTDGARWTTRQAFEHLSIAETGIRRLCEEVAQGGSNGAPKGFDVDGFNHRMTDTYAAKTLDELFVLFAETRRRTADFARSLDDAQLALRGRHPALGDSSLGDALKMIYLHNAMHIRDIKKQAA